MTEETLRGLAVDSMGRIVAAGSRGRILDPWPHDNNDFLAVRLLASGAPDPTFGGTGRVLTRLSTASNEANTVAVLGDAAIVVAGAVDGQMVVAQHPATAGVKSSGWNPVGQLGNGTDSPSAAAAPALYGATAVSAGAYHGLATKGDGTLWAWGWNGVGQLGDGTTWDRWSPVPVPVRSMDPIMSFAAGQFHSLAVEGDHQLIKAWGGTPPGSSATEPRPTATSR
jgi:hypothetical protein